MAESYISGESIYLVQGFARSILQIPADIITICAGYYYIEQDDYFTEYANSYCLYEDQKTIRKQYKAVGSAFGNVTVRSSFQETHSWTFKVLNIGAALAPMCFGITASSDINVRKDCFRSKDTFNYCAQSPEHCKSGGVVRSG